MHTSLRISIGSANKRKNYEFQLVICSTCSLHICSTLWRLAAFGGFREKNTKSHKALCKNFSGLVSATDSVKKRSKSCSLHSKKNFFVGGCGFFVSDVISVGLSGHLGPLHLALGSNR